MLHFFAKRLNELHKVKREERGFTLIELLVVIIIIGILAAIAIPIFLNQRERAQDAEAVSAARNAATIVQSIATECGGEYVLPPACTADITGAAVEAEEPSLANANPTVTVAADDASYTVTVTSETGQVATFDSTTGETNLGPAPTP